MSEEALNSPGFAWGEVTPAPSAGTAPAEPLPSHDAPVVASVPRVRMDLGDLMAAEHPDFDPVMFMVGVAQAQDWPKSLRLQAAKDAARYLRPLVTPEHGAGDRGTIIIVDQTRDAAARGDVAALQALGERVASSPGAPGDARPVTLDGDGVIIDPTL